MDKASFPDTTTDRRRRERLLAPGIVLQNRYRITRELGSGGMGAVYQAVDQRLDADVALKETFSAEERLRRQFEQEARLLAQLHHPSLPRVSDYFTEDGRAFLVMQFIAGADLARVMSEQSEPFAQTQVIAWADQLLDALIYLHTRDRQIIHRDIKPHNLKITTTGQIALLDFGLAKTHMAADNSTTASSNSIFGYTRGYSPLEQMQDLGTTPQSDIYALGATLYHLLTGVKPPNSVARAGALANSKCDPLQPANELCPAIGGDISAVLSKALALVANDRYQTASEFREALRKIGRSDVVESTRSSAPASTNNGFTKLTAVQNGGASIDPFDSYSILRPQDDLFHLPRTNRRPAILITFVAIGLIAIAAAYPRRLIDSTAKILDYADTTTSQKITSTALVRENKSENSTPRSSPTKNSSANSQPSVRVNTNGQKRPTQHQTASRTRSIKPPPFSITP